MLAGLINATLSALKIKTPAAGEVVLWYKSDDGIFYGRLADGTDVPMGGGGSQSLAVTIAETDPLEYTATPIGGTAPYEYAWSNARTAANDSPVNAVFDGVTDEETVTLGDDDNSAALLRCVVTDANGLVGVGYFAYENIVIA